MKWITRSARRGKNPQLHSRPAYDARLSTGESLACSQLPPTRPRDGWITRLLGGSGWSLCRPLWATLIDLSGVRSPEVRQMDGHALVASFAGGTPGPSELQLLKNWTGTCWLDSCWSVWKAAMLLDWVKWWNPDMDFGTLPPIISIFWPGQSKIELTQDLKWKIWKRLDLDQF